MVAQASTLKGEERPLHKAEDPLTREPPCCMHLGKVEGKLIT